MDHIMNAFDTKRREYRFKEESNAKLFAMNLPGYCDPVVRRGLPQYKGQAETGWTVFCKANSIATELAIDRSYKQIADCYKMEAL